MKRRTLLAASLAAPLAAPALAQGNARVLRFVPESNLANPDPVWTTTTIARNHALLIWDMLYALDENYEPQPQMLAGHELSDDKLTWRFTLREGLKFSTGEPVLPADCIASVQRWAKRRPLGQTLLERTEEMRAIDDRRFEFRLKKPYSLIPRAFADSCFIMPERIAQTDPFKQISEYIGSGPYTFPVNEWVSGSKAVYLRNPGYVPRNEKPSFLSGGKVAHFDRIEWIVMPDPATSMGALQNGEIDWVQRADYDLLAPMRKMRNVKVAVNDRTGAVGMLGINHLHPPFKDNPKLLQAILVALKQEDYMAAAVGAEPELFRVPCGVFTPGMPMANDEKLSVFSAPRDIERAKRLVKESGYAGEAVTILSPADYPHLAAFSQVTNDLLQRIGIRTDFLSMDWGTLVQRRASKEAPEKGGWNIFTTTYEGLTVADPSSHIPLRGNGLQAWFGWPTSPRLEALRDAWLDAPDLGEQKRIAREMQAIAFEEVPFIPVGQLFSATAHRTSLTDIIPASMPIFWNVKRA